MIRRIIALALIAIGTVYLFVGIAQFPIFLLAGTGVASLTDTFILFLQAPLLMVRYGEPLPTSLFFLNAVLSSVYIFLISMRVLSARKLRLHYGLSGSLLGLISVGCVACGALLSPLAFAVSIGLPLAIAGRAELMLGIAANLLLIIGIVTLIKGQSVRA